MNISLSLFAPENNVVLRDGFGRPVSRHSRGILPDFRGGVYFLFKLPSAIGSVPSLSGHAIAYRWRSLPPRFRRHRASSPQGGSSNTTEVMLFLHHPWTKNNMRFSLFQRQLYTRYFFLSKRKKERPHAGLATTYIIAYG